MSLEQYTPQPPKSNFPHYHFAILLAVAVSSIFFTIWATAGTLNPSSAPGATMKTLQEIYDSVAGTTFSSSSITADQNGSLIEGLKYLNNNIFVASSSSGFYFSPTSRNVGIGTTAPGVKFHVIGAASISSNFEVGGTASISNVFRVGASGTGTVTVNANPSSSVATLQLGSGVSVTGSGNDFSASAANGIYLFQPGGAGVRINTGNTAQNFRFGYGSGAGTPVSLMILTSTGNLGIGASVSSPEQRLEVAGNIFASSSGNIDLILRSTTTNGASNNDDAKFTLRTSSSSERFDIINGGGTKLVAVASSGNVGIGTISVDAKLEVNGTASISNSFYLISSGNVGIGTSIPSYKLQVVASGSSSHTRLLDNATILPSTDLVPLTIAAGAVDTNNQGGKIGLTFRHDPGHIGRQARIYGVSEAINSNDVGLAFYTASSAAAPLERLRITGIGHIGIGTTAPALTNGSSTRLIAVEGTTNPGIAFKDTGTSKQYLVHASGTDFNVFDANNTATRMTINTSGAFHIVFTESTGGNAVCHASSGTTAVVDRVVDCASAPSADYMEMYPLAPDVAEGEIVVPSRIVSVKTDKGDAVAQLEKSSRPYETDILGITSIASEAGDFNSIGHNIDEQYNPKPIALAGRVKVKFSAENGQVQPGDHLTSSSIPGVAMKATKPGTTVGVALEASDPSRETVMVFVKVAYWVPEDYVPSENSLVQLDTSSLLNQMLQRLGSAFNIVISNGLIKTVQGVFDRVEVKQGITVQDQLTKEPYCLTIANGAVVTSPGACGR